MSVLKKRGVDLLGKSYEAYDKLSRRCAALEKVAEAARKYDGYGMDDLKKALRALDTGGSASSIEKVQG